MLQDWHKVCASAAVRNRESAEEVRKQFVKLSTTYLMTRHVKVKVARGKTHLIAVCNLLTPSWSFSFTGE